MGNSRPNDINHRVQPSEHNTWPNGERVTRNQINILLSTIVKRNDFPSACDNNDNENKTFEIWSEFTNILLPTESLKLIKLKYYFRKFFDHRSNKYFNYDVNVQINVIQAMSTTFPAVTICNINPIRKSQIENVAEMNHLVKKYNNKIEKFNCNRSASKYNLIPQSLFNLFIKTPTTIHDRCIPKFGQTKDGRDERLDFQFSNEMQELYQTLNDSIKYTIGHDIYDLVVECDYSGGLCVLENQHGNCFTYNSILNNKVLKSTVMSGPKYGLSITFNVQQEEYIDEISQTAGLVVVVHDPKRMPFPEDCFSQCSHLCWNQNGDCVFSAICSSKNTSSMCCAAKDACLLVDPNNLSPVLIKNNNFGKLIVYFESLSYSAISETPSCEVQQLLSDIGGVLGLYIGFSLLTIVEFIVLIYDLSFVGLSNRCRKNKTKSNFNRHNIRGKSSDTYYFDDAIKNNVATINDRVGMGVNIQNSIDKNYFTHEGYKINEITDHFNHYGKECGKKVLKINSGDCKKEFPQKINDCEGIVGRNDFNSRGTHQNENFIITSDLVGI
ncbi:hypothetical protein HELRODRAFT_168358 [Helobdella robusta]|uniref:Uncharacterized protein n=1 Tax=Helobdella robusta TaxID=6412 RepID=T1F0G7_HELRO|nr:hypothetical protein HELRODRAFT_168358 [Helobdella robusta]ESO09377.1 hypothetical protein HELRODRAFT_168358 [Helobdella robusta]